MKKHESTTLTVARIEGEGERGGCRSCVLVEWLFSSRVSARSKTARSGGFLEISRTEDDVSYQQCLVWTTSRIDQAGPSGTRYCLPPPGSRHHPFGLLCYTCCCRHAIPVVVAVVLVFFVAFVFAVVGLVVVGVVAFAAVGLVVVVVVVFAVISLGHCRGR